MKILARLIAAAAALLVASVVAFFVYVDVIAGSAIERGASYALGVDTRVGFVRLSLLRGFVNIGSLAIDNPPGNFDERQLLSLDDARIRVDLDSLRQDVVVAPEITISGVEVAIEKDGKATNIGKLLANLKRFEKGEAKQPDAEPAEPGKRIVVNELLIRDVAARYEHTDGIGDLGKIEVLVPEIRLRNIGAHNAKGVAMEELTNIIVKAIFLAIARNGAALPNWLVGDMQGDLRGLTSLPIQIVDDTAGTLADTLPQPAGDAVRELGAKAVGGLGGLLGGGKKDGD